MEKVRVFWKNRAISHLKKQAEWYAETMGIAAADKFWNGMIAAGDLLSADPYLGKLEPIFKDSAKSYRSLVQHKDYKIVYTLEDNSQIQILAIWHCRKDLSTL